MLKNTELRAKIRLRVTIYLVNIIVRRAMTFKYAAKVQSKRRFTLNNHKLTAKLLFQPHFPQLISSAHTLLGWIEIWFLEQSISVCGLVVLNSMEYGCNGTFSGHCWSRNISWGVALVILFTLSYLYHLCMPILASSSSCHH